jgi:hypothetical protein
LDQQKLIHVRLGLVAWWSTMAAAIEDRVIHPEREGPASRFNGIARCHQPQQGDRCNKPSDRRYLFLPTSASGRTGKDPIHWAEFGANSNHEKACYSYAILLIIFSMKNRNNY